MRALRSSFFFYHFEFDSLVVLLRLAGFSLPGRRFVRCPFFHAGDSLGYSPERMRCAAAMTSARLNTVSFLRCTHGLSQPAL